MHIFCCFYLGMESLDLKWLLIELLVQKFRTLSDEQYYKCVEEFMVHGPCGVIQQKSPFMLDGLCTKHFPKKYSDSTMTHKHAYPVYRRRNNNMFVDKGGVRLDDRYVVPHN